MPDVSAVVPAYNPSDYLFETLAAIRSQSYQPIEIVLVNDGTDQPESAAVLARAAGLVDVYIDQPNSGLAAARNSGFAAAAGSLVLPIDCDDLIDPRYVEQCVSALASRPELAFAFTDYSVFGTSAYPESCSYNLYDLLSRNTLTYAALIRKSAWRESGGYDASMRFGYEDWEFWLRLGANGHFGVHVPERLFRYRKHGPSLFDVALSRHEELVAHIRRKLPQLYDYDAQMQVKAVWRPAVCVVGGRNLAGQTIGDVQSSRDSAPAVPVPGRVVAPAMLVAAGNSLDANSAELAALAVWSGTERVVLPDGSVASRPDTGAAAGEATGPLQKTRSGGSLLRRHLANAELASWRPWLRHPLRSLVRLIPLRFKERINTAFGRPVFDLSFYLRFQPRSVLLDHSLVEPLRYMPRRSGRRRLALVTPHLGDGGAEKVLAEIAASFDRDSYEILLIASHPADSRWAPHWRAIVDHVYDLGPLVPPERMSVALYSIIANWQCDGIVLQNSLFAYSALPLIRKHLPGARTIDLVHAASDDWDVIAATAPVSGLIDIRIAISEQVRARLAVCTNARQRIEVIRNGIDLERFQPVHRSGSSKNILFLGRLDAVKRPSLLVPVATELLRLRGADFRIVVAGDGPELADLQAKAAAAKVSHLFEFRGFVTDTPALLAEADLLIVPSLVEGVPLAALEAMATGCPVVASNVGAIAEAVDGDSGILVQTGKGEERRLAEALNALLADPELRERFGRAGRQRVEALYDAAAARRAYARLFDPA